MQMAGDTTENIVIVGGGICGLATALALHRYATIRYYTHTHTHTYVCACVRELMYVCINLFAIA